MKLELFLQSYLSQVSIYGDLCAISFGGGLFLVVPYVSKCLSSHAFLEDSLLHSGSILGLSCHDFGVLNNASIESIVIGFGLDGALFDIQHDKCLGKFVENVGYVSSFLDIFMENHNYFVSLNQLMSFVIGQGSVLPMLVSQGPSADDMLAYLTWARPKKDKFEEFGDQGMGFKWFSICLLSKDHSRKQLEGENWPSVGEGHPTAGRSPAPTVADRLLLAEPL
ncbi:hypothetical protein M9H77_06968 [Catharanthus roseus]|uniref:Uncharacterized protein n=1 Tax=Catharanthus roseus TaxID=4058 RepID=A0ACC0BU04_CATRO|nr:hypothetical protein M9H77_06968 [Catharanthus roseus]